MSIKLRIVAVFGVFAFAAVLVVLGLMVANARDAVQDEMSATLDLVAALVGPLMAEPAALELAIRAIDDRARHIDIIDGEVMATHHGQRRNDAPGWFVDLIGAAPIERRLTSATGSTITLRADPGDEIAEVWTDVRSLALAGAVMLPFCLGGFALAVRQATRPVGTLAADLDTLRLGRFDVPVPPCAIAELAPLRKGIEALRLALRDKTLENLELAATMVRCQDEERQALARDVHDHLGPLLFSLKIDLAKGPPETLALVEDMQLWHRQIIDRLHPPSLDHVPLSRVLAERINRWRRLKPDVDFTLELADGLDDLAPVTARTVRLVVQEAIMNALRHGAPRQVRVGFARPGPLLIEVADDGRGIGPGSRQGIGLAAMGHRVRALGGRLEIGATEAGGTSLRAYLPADARGETHEARAAG